MIVRFRRARAARLPQHQRGEQQAQRALDDYLGGYARYDQIVEEDTAWDVRCCVCHVGICTCPEHLPLWRRRGAHRYKDGAVVCSFACGRQERDRRERRGEASPFGLMALALTRAGLALPAPPDLPTPPEGTERR